MLPDSIYWMGWETSWQALREAGWVITTPPPYNNWRSRRRTEYLYIRHPQTGMMGRGNLTSHAGKTYLELDFLTPERNNRFKSPAVYTERELGEEDIERLLGMIQEIQSRRPRRRKPTEVIDITPLIVAI